MKLDRNINADGRGKYALLKLRNLDAVTAPGGSRFSQREEIESAINLLENIGVLDWGNTVDSEFFVIRLKDRHASAALANYGASVFGEVPADEEYGFEIINLALRAGPCHPNCKKPD